MALDDNDVCKLIGTMERTSRETNGHIQLLDNLRQEVTVELELCLVDRVRLERYLAQLAEAGHEKRCQDEGSGLLDNEQQFAAVIRHGLSVLDDASLVRCALNPFVVGAMADLIEEGIFKSNEEVSSYWNGLRQTFVCRLPGQNRHTAFLKPKEKERPPSSQ